MANYKFILRFNIENCQRSTDDFLEELAEAGCTDAFIGIGQTGRLAMAFSRESKSEVHAMCSTMADVKSVIPEAILIEAGSSL